MSVDNLPNHKRWCVDKHTHTHTHTHIHTTRVAHLCINIWKYTVFLTHVVTIYICIYTYIHIYIYIYICIYIYKHMYWYIYIYTHICVHTCLYTYTFDQSCLCVPADLQVVYCFFISFFVFACVCGFASIGVSINTHTHAHTHIYTQPSCHIFVNAFENNPSHPRTMWPTPCVCRVRDI